MTEYTIEICGYESGLTKQAVQDTIQEQFPNSVVVVEEVDNDD